MYTSKLDFILKPGIIAILRASSSNALMNAAEALQEGGVIAIEVTLTTPGALKTIEEARVRFGDQILFGAGSVLDPESARAAILAGAQFIVMPTMNPRVIELCRRYGTIVIPGAYTPTEIITAWEAGADLIKLFPASVGGPEMVKALLAPLPQVKFVPVGGIDLINTASYIDHGAVAVGVGSSLVSDNLLNDQNNKEITERARQFVKQIQEARRG